jgi:hypothetical protein
MTNSLQRFYVYAFLRSEDSEIAPKYSPYYIGKGSDRRAFRDSTRVISKPKNKSYIVFLQEGLTEDQAFNLEKYCIALYGRIDLGTGILRNLTDGGEGASGARPSQETRAKLGKACRGKKFKQEHKDRLAVAHIKYRCEFISPGGEIYIIENVNQFAKEQGLNHCHLYSILSGKRKHHKNWTGRIIENLK